MALTQLRDHRQDNLPYLVGLLVRVDRTQQQHGAILGNLLATQGEIHQEVITIRGVVEDVQHRLEIVHQDMMNGFRDIRNQFRDRDCGAFRLFKELSITGATTAGVYYGIPLLGMEQGAANFGGLFTGTGLGLYFECVKIILEAILKLMKMIYDIYVSVNTIVINFFTQIADMIPIPIVNTIVKGIFMIMIVCVNLLFLRVVLGFFGIKLTSIGSLLGKIVNTIFTFLYNNINNLFSALYDILDGIMNEIRPDGHGAEGRFLRFIKNAWNTFKHLIWCTILCAFDLMSGGYVGYAMGAESMEKCGCEPIVQPPNPNQNRTWSQWWSGNTTEPATGPATGPTTGGKLPPSTYNTVVKNIKSQSQSQKIKKPTSSRKSSKRNSKHKIFKELNNIYGFKGIENSASGIINMFSPENTSKYKSNGILAKDFMFLLASSQKSFVSLHNATYLLTQIFFHINNFYNRKIKTLGKFKNYHMVNLPAHPEKKILSTMVNLDRLFHEEMSKSSKSIARGRTKKKQRSKSKRNVPKRSGSKKKRKEKK